MRWCICVVLATLAAGCDGGGEGTEPAHPGEQTYVRYCFSCHAAGVAGAPRVGQAGAWAPRIARGREAMLESTVQGVPPGMPPRGLCTTCTEEELTAAIDYMMERSR